MSAKKLLLAALVVVLLAGFALGAFGFLTGAVALKAAPAMAVPAPAPVSSIFAAPASADGLPAAPTAMIKAAPAM